MESLPNRTRKSGARFFSTTGMTYGDTAVLSAFIRLDMIRMCSAPGVHERVGLGAQHAQQPRLRWRRTDTFVPWEDMPSNSPQLQTLKFSRSGSVCLLSVCVALHSHYTQLENTARATYLPTAMSKAVLLADLRTILRHINKLPSQGVNSFKAQIMAQVCCYCLSGLRRGVVYCCCTDLYGGGINRSIIRVCLCVCVLSSH